MPSSTRSNKESQLLFSPDPASLEHSILKEARSSSFDNNTCSSLDFRQAPSTQALVPSTDTHSPPSTEDTHLPWTDIFHPTSIDISVRTSIDTEPRDMFATLILVRDERGDLHDQEGHLRNPAGQRLDAQRNAIPELSRQTPAPIDRRALLTYRVQMPKIDVKRLNALRPKPKPSENPPETVRTPSDDGTDPMEVHAQQYQKQQGKSTVILTRSCKLGAFNPQRSALLIVRQQHLFVARFSSSTVNPGTSPVDRHSLTTVDRRHSSSIRHRSILQFEHLSILSRETCLRL
ncbi:hypothetical protein F2Q69_00053579 [Brassica cretica]|uniref:Uncharacterized protein n=1 Tax=Brassica cretica TaxID=69181 RepID=A0A8S9N9K8_BRACR|nr:hypothetical protein F2Q69_00053579 [Brassica cretica]